MCRAGLAAHCRSRLELGVRGWDGCLAERFKLPIRNLIEVPDRLDDQAAVFAAALSTAIHAAHLVRVEGKPYITVLGENVHALLCAQAMARLNASVRLLGVHSAKYSLCEKWGIKHRDVADVGRRADQDIVVDATQSTRGLDLALQLVRPRGKIVLIGAPAERAPSLGALVENEIELLGCRGGSLADALGMLARREIDPIPLITKRARLADAVSALRVASDPDQVAVLIEP
jgi:threonine dehydrogenase-like Zn-dependent dehydrogenase